MVRRLSSHRSASWGLALVAALLWLAPGCQREEAPGGSAEESETAAVAMPAPAFGPVRARAIERAAEHPPTREAERDDLFMLLAFAIARADWQGEAVGSRRGHNIAAVLVDGADRPVLWARNSVFASEDLTRHAELVAMECHLAGEPERSLEGFTLYGTLEPCAMCAGMMLFARLSRIVFGQSDTDFGGTLERFSTYPFQVTAEPSRLYHRYWLEELFREYEAGRRFARISAFLRMPDIRAVFDDAVSRLEQYTVRFPENEEILRRVRAFHAEARAGRGGCVSGRLPAGTP